MQACEQHKEFPDIAYKCLYIVGPICLCIVFCKVCITVYAIHPLAH